MHIIYIHQYFNTPDQPGGTRSYWIAKKLVDRGHKVTMITSNRNKNASLNYLEVDGFTVKYFNVNYSQKMGILKRISSFLKFSVLTFLYVFKHRRKVDFIYATSTPLTVGISPLLMNIFFNIKYIFEVRDLWPEVPIQLGFIKNKILIKLLRFFEYYFYKCASQVIALSPGMYDGVVDVLKSSNKVFMIPNMSKPEIFYKRPINDEIINTYNINKSNLSIIYFGAIGLTNGLTTVVKYFSKVQDLPVNFYLAGEGAELEKIKHFIKCNNMKNVFLLGDHPMKKISEIVNCCDVSLISFASFPILNTNSPNKLFDSLSAQKPIIVNSDGWTKDIVERYKCGYYYDFNSFEGFRSMITQIIQDKKDGSLEKKAYRSRAISETEFDKDILTNRICSIVELNKI